MCVGLCADACVLDLDKSMGNLVAPLDILWFADSTSCFVSSFFSILSLYAPSPAYFSSTSFVFILSTNFRADVLNWLILSLSLLYFSIHPPCFWPAPYQLFLYFSRSFFGKKTKWRWKIDLRFVVFVLFLYLAPCSLFWFQVVAWWFLHPPVSVSFSFSPNPTLGPPLCIPLRWYYEVNFLVLKQPIHWIAIIYIKTLKTKPMFVWCCLSNA